MLSDLRNLVKVFSLPQGVLSFSHLLVRVRHTDTNEPAALYYRDGRSLSRQGLGSLSSTGRFDVWVQPRKDYVLQLVNRDQTFKYQEFRLPPNGDSDVALPGGVTPSSLISSDPADNALQIGADNKLYVAPSPQLSSANW